MAKFFKTYYSHGYSDIEESGKGHNVDIFLEKSAVAPICRFFYGNKIGIFRFDKNKFEEQLIYARDRIIKIYAKHKIKELGLVFYNSKIVSREASDIDHIKKLFKKIMPKNIKFRITIIQGKSPLYTSS